MAERYPKDRIEALSEMLESAGRITVTTHLRPDGDAIGSSVALASFLRSCMGKEVSVAVSGEIPSFLSFIIPDDVSILRHDAIPEETVEWIAHSDLVVLLDASDFDRTDTLEDTFRRSEASKILIDHHKYPASGQFGLVFSQTETSSTCELLFNILLDMPGIEGRAELLPADARRALMAGMTTDTNNFSNSVYPGTFEMASKLLASGVDRDAVLSELYQHYRENKLRMTGHLLKDSMTILPCGVAYMIVYGHELEEYGIMEGELEGVVNMPLGIERVRMSMLLREDKGCFRVSIRSKEGTSAFKMAQEHFNGGGHEQASGGRLFFPGDIPDTSKAREYVEKVCSQFFGQ